MNVALLDALYGKSASALVADLLSATEALPSAVGIAAQLASDRDRASLERLERLAERLDGLRRLSLQARAALQNELGPKEAA